MSKIIVKNLTFYYGNQAVLKDVNLDVKSNEIFAVFGPANSGITTLLKALNRLNDLVPGAHHDGEITLDGKNIHSPDVSVTELRRRVGMVFEVPTPLPMSIFDNVAYGPRMGGLRNKMKLLEKVENALRMAVLWDEVKDRLNTSAMRMSGGQQQRLCIARILALSPDVILLDRPCSGLDPISTLKIEDSLRQLKDSYTIIIAPHNVQQTARISDRAGFLLMGNLIEHGETSEMFTNPVNKQTSDYITGRFG